MRTVLFVAASLLTFCCAPEPGHGHAVLLRDDALADYRHDGGLYAYGVLIRVDAPADPLTDLTTVEHPSIKSLYNDPAKPLADPFVHGPNAN